MCTLSLVSPKMHESIFIESIFNEKSVVLNLFKWHTSERYSRKRKEKKPSTHRDSNPGPLVHQTLTQPLCDRLWPWRIAIRLNHLNQFNKLKLASMNLLANWARAVPRLKFSPWVANGGWRGQGVSLAPEIRSSMSSGLACAAPVPTAHSLDHIRSYDRFYSIAVGSVTLWRTFIFLATVAAMSNSKATLLMVRIVCDILSLGVSDWWNELN